MSKVVIEYNEMEKLYSDYLKMENETIECMTKVGELSAIFEETFGAGETSKLLKNEVNEEGSAMLGFVRVTSKLDNLKMLFGMTRLLIETSTDVLKSLDEKISNQIIGDIVSQHGVSHKVAQEAYNEHISKTQTDSGMTSEDFNTMMTRSVVMEKGGEA